MRFRAVAVSLVVALACTAPQADVPPSPTARVASGGTLRIGVVQRPAGFNDPYPYDYHDPKWGHGYLFRCCLLRTLLSYSGAPAGEGGSVPYPDLAAGPAEIAADGLTWTFHLRPGIRYAPPYGDVEVQAADFIRAIERNIRFVDRIPDYWRDIEAIEGAVAYAEGEASSIAGLEAPDPLTLVARLSRPAGGLAHGFAYPMTAPIPEAALVAVEDEYGPLLAATGPYMFEESGALPARPANEGLPPNTMTLVRNPNWDPSTDGLRAAHVDRIEIRPAGTIEEALAKVERGELDFLDVTLTRDELDRYRSDPAFRGRVHALTSESLYYIPMNLALPPFDDVHVRRAVSWAVDKVAIMDAHTEWRAADMDRRFLREIGVVARHSFPDTHVRGLLLDYEPYPTAQGRGDVARARSEMARSRYDSDGDGVCDMSACDSVPLAAPSAEVAAPLIAALGAIGIDAVSREPSETFDMYLPATRVPIQLNWSLWFSAMDGGGHAFIFEGIRDPGAGFALNQSLLGTPGQVLETWGYPVTEVPSLDDKIRSCDESSSYLRFVCYAELDQLISEQVVPIVPVYTHLRSWLVSPNMSHFVLEQSSGVAPAIDQISLRR